MTGPPPSPALFLDRDGVINHELGYLHDPADVLFVDGIIPLCQSAQALGYKLVVVTNQSGIARGFYTEAQFHRLMDFIRAELAKHSVTLDAVYFCPYHPVHGIGEYQREHPDRKPSPGMLLRAAEELAIDLSKSVLVGDRCSDIAAANSAGLWQAFLLAGTEAGHCPGKYIAVDDLHEVELYLESWVPDEP